ncbi:uncharacterized protein BO96DRAFT_209707 [Aspergillus niger CBS 101883]|uniref:uncharacterized protein n=1 Tax=Aspergillus lacticoffeatus (strain CBS 101883) TaxID=1450533 RepID=UPI000D7F4DCE|nr:uncharacterized protein BO96DRAFT_209707 [Aspergillus niger CBS 101883]PYH59379.1 hypothetical protein BO96DRAFT_209707 [Aspergillus niger CBS 101883]
MYPQSLLVLSQGLGCPTCIQSQTGGEQHIPPGRYQHPRHNVSNYSQVDGCSSLVAISTPSEPWARRRHWSGK